VKKWGIQQLVALVLSLLLWAFVRYNQPGGVGTQALSQLTLNVPIRVKNNPPNMLPYDMTKDEVRVTLQGDSTAIAALRDGMVQAYVDLTGADSPNVYSEVKVLAPGGLAVLAKDPNQVTVKLSNNVNRTVRVRVILSGSPANGLSAGEVRLEPKSVVVTGPESLVADVDVVVSKIVLDGQSQDYSLDLRDLTPVNSQGMEITAKLGKGLKILPSVVSATVPILSKNHTVAVAVSLDQLHINPAKGWSYRMEVEPEFVTLRVGTGQKAPKFLLTKPQTIAISTKVDSRDLDLIIPDGVEVVGSSTVTLKVIPERVDFTDAGGESVPPATPNVAPPTPTANPTSKRDG
jgi:YbbR domain-containing protein